MHAADVLRGRLIADEQDAGAVFVTPHGVLGGKHGLAARRPRRCRQAAAQDLQRRLRVDHGVQQLVDLRRLHARHRLAAVDQPLVHHLHRDAHRGRRRTLAGACLQQVQRAILHGELDILHVAVMPLQPLAYLRQLGVDGGKAMAQRRQRLGIANAGHHVLTLRVGQELAEQVLLAARRVAGEHHPGAGVLAAVAEHHGLHVHRRAPVVGNAVQAAVGGGAVVVPGGEHGVDAEAQLIPRPVRKSPPGGVLHPRLHDGDEVAQRLGTQVAVVRHPLLCLGFVEQRFERLVLHAHDHVAEHGDETAV